jgi:hypothetical protein
VKDALFAAWDLQEAVIWLRLGVSWLTKTKNYLEREREMTQKTMAANNSHQSITRLDANAAVSD